MPFDPFDASTSDYFETKPVPVYDRDHAPQTMWDAIRLGVRDLEATEQATKYRIDMNGWHMPQFDGSCAVCFAGAVMARTLRADPSEQHSMTDWGPGWARVFDLLDDARQGCLRTGLFRLFRVNADGFDFPFTPYETNPAAFKRDMLALADRLEGEG